MSGNQPKNENALKNNFAKAPLSEITNPKKRKIDTLIEPKLANFSSSNQAKTPSPSIFKKTALGFIPRQLRRKAEPARVSKEDSIPLNSTTSSKPIINSIFSASANALTSGSSVITTNMPKSSGYIHLEIPLRKIRDVESSYSPKNILSLKKIF